MNRDTRDLVDDENPLFASAFIPEVGQDGISACALGLDVGRGEYIYAVLVADFGESSDKQANELRLAHSSAPRDPAALIFH